MISTEANIIASIWTVWVRVSTNQDVSVILHDSLYDSFIRISPAIIGFTITGIILACFLKKENPFGIIISSFCFISSGFLFQKVFESWESIRSFMKANEQVLSFPLLSSILVFFISTQLSRIVSVNKEKQETSILFIKSITSHINSLRSIVFFTSYNYSVLIVSNNPYPRQKIEIWKNILNNNKYYDIAFSEIGIYSKFAIELISNYSLSYENTLIYMDSFLLEVDEFNSKLKVEQKEKVSQNDNINILEGGEFFSGAINMETNLFYIDTDQLFSGKLFFASFDRKKVLLNSYFITLLIGRGALCLYYFKVTFGEKEDLSNAIKNFIELYSMIIFNITQVLTTLFEQESVTEDDIILSCLDYFREIRSNFKKINKNFQKNIYSYIPKDCEPQYISILKLKKPLSSNLPQSWIDSNPLTDKINLIKFIITVDNSEFSAVEKGKNILKEYCSNYKIEQSSEQIIEDSEGTVEIISPWG